MLTLAAGFGKIWIVYLKLPRWVVVEGRPDLGQPFIGQPRAGVLFLVTFKVLLLYRNMWLSSASPCCSNIVELRAGVSFKRYLVWCELAFPAYCRRRIPRVAFQHEFDPPPTNPSMQRGVGVPLGLSGGHTSRIRSEIQGCG